MQRFAGEAPLFGTYFDVVFDVLFDVIPILLFVCLLVSVCFRLSLFMRICLFACCLHLQWFCSDFGLFVVLYKICLAFAAPYKGFA